MRRKISLLLHFFLFPTICIFKRSFNAVFSETDSTGYHLLLPTPDYSRNPKQTVVLQACQITSRKWSVKQTKISTYLCFMLLPEMFARRCLLLLSSLDFTHLHTPEHFWAFKIFMPLFTHNSKMLYGSQLAGRYPNWVTFEKCF